MPDKKPLSGRRIAVTRPGGTSAGWRAHLEAQGAEVLELPLIQVTKDVNLETLAEVFQGLSSYEWIIFTSPNGVDAFFAKYEGKAPGQKKREVGAAVPFGGMATAEVLTGMAVFLASAEATYIVAQTYNVDGGNWMS